MGSERGTSAVIGSVLLVAVVVLLSASLAVTFADVVEEAKDTNEKPIPVSENYLVNGGFEDGAGGAWKYAGPSSIVREPNSGDYALRLNTSAPEFVGQDVTASQGAGKIYRMCATTKVTDPGTEFYVGIQYYDDAVKNSSDIIEKAQYRIEWTSYRERCVLTDFDDDQTVKAVDVWAYQNASTGTAYVDDVSLTEVRYFADPDEDTDDQSV